MKANGKADLYFHSYFWDRYLQTLQDLQQKAPSSASPNKVKAVKKKKSAEEEGEDGKSDEEEIAPIVVPGEKVNLSSDKYGFMKRLQGLSQTLSKVIVNIKKFPFTQKTYLKYATDFGQRQTVKKMKYLEEIQRALFVA
jgi:hypothetical protein